MNRYSRRVDSNQPRVVKELTDMSYSVLSLVMLGRGKPDLLVSKWNVSVLVELKRPKTEGGNRNHKSSVVRQQEFADTWKGCPVVRAETTQQIDDAWYAVWRGLGGIELRRE
jgi:hypothetical protein